MFVHIKIHCFSRDFLYTVLSNTKTLQIICLTYRWVPYSCYHSKPEWIWKKWAWRLAVSWSFCFTVYISFSGLLTPNRIWHINRTLSSATTPVQSGPGSDCNKGVLRIPQSITEGSPPDCLVAYPGHSFGESYLSAETQSVYSTAPADWAKSWKSCHVIAHGDEEVRLILFSRDELALSSSQKVTVRKECGSQRG